MSDTFGDSIHQNMIIKAKHLLTYSLPGNRKLTLQWKKRIMPAY